MNWIMIILLFHIVISCDTSKVYSNFPFLLPSFRYENFSIRILQILFQIVFPTFYDNELIKKNNNLISEYFLIYAFWLKIIALRNRSPNWIIQNENKLRKSLVWLTRWSMAWLAVCLLACLHVELFNAMEILFIWKTGGTLLSHSKLSYYIRFNSWD